MKRPLFALGLAYAVGLLTGASAAPAVGPGWFAVSGQAVAPGQITDGGASPKTLMASAIDEVTPELMELARNLHHDPVLIFEFVRNKIDYVPYNGFKKGARQTLLDRAGNDADQAALLMALLQAGGHSAVYKSGIQRIPTADTNITDTVASWLDVEETVSAVQWATYQNALPVAVFNDWTYMDRVWVEAQIEGQTYQLDAAFKPHRRKTPLDFAGLMGYDRAVLLAAAGGETNAAYVRNLNETNLNQQLTAYAVQLAEAIRSNHFHLSVADAWGEAEIIEATVTNLPVSLPFEAEDVTAWSNPHTNLLHALRLQHGSMDETLSLPEVAGNRLSVSYDAIGNEGGAVELPGSYSFITFAGQRITARLGVGQSGTIWIKNNGGTSIQITSIDFLGETDDFGVNTSAGWSVAPGQTVGRVVTFRPMTVGSRSATYRVWSGPYFMDLPIEGVVVDQRAVITNTASASFYEYDELDFFPHAGNEATGYVRFKNTGNQMIYINSIAADGDWSHFAMDDWSGAGGGIPPGGAYSRLVRFYAADPGTHEAGITLHCTYGGNPYSPRIALHGHAFQPCARLWLGTNLVAQESGVMTNSAEAMTLSVSHPHSHGNQTNPYNFKRGSTYAVILDFGQAHNGYLLAERQRLLDEYRRAGYADDSREVLTETLNVMGQTWMRQTALANALQDRISGVRQLYLHRLGVMAQETGYYIDIKGQIAALYSRDGTTSGEFNRLKSGGLIDSALEHGILEQMQGTNRPGASTAKLIQLANSGGKIIFKATSNNYASVVRPALTNYTTAEMDEFQSQVNLGQTLILPEDAHITLAEWQGKGYVVYGPTATGFELGMIIGGDYYGGYAGYQGPVNTVAVAESYRPAQLQSSDVPRQLVSDPVDIASGHFVHDATDLVVGTGAPPLGLAMRRTYSSGQNNLRSPLGHGWSHELDIKAHVRSAGDAGLGTRAPLDAVPLMVAAVASGDLMANEDNPKGWATAALIAKWAVDQLNDNAVSIQMGDRNVEFIRMPDGSYNPPPGSTATLEKTNGIFRLRERFDTVLDFTANNRLSSWTDASGNRLSFIYNSKTNVQSVTDAYGRSLAFGYSGTNLLSVSDGTGRSVAYSVSNGNLTNVVDSGGNAWRYAYDSQHRIVTARDPAGRTTVSNLYSAVSGRVLSQRNGAGTLWNMYVVPQHRGVEEDPLGNRSTYYFDDKTRQVATIDPLGNRRTTVYDGQNHVVERIDANGNLERMEYDRWHNVTNRLDALERSTAFTYDVHHRLVEVRDPLGHASQIEYDAHHRPVRQIDALSNETVLTYFTNGLLQTQTDARGAESTYTYDAWGNPATVAQTDGGTVSNEWNARGDLLQSRDALGLPTTYTWDARRLSTSVRDAAGNIESNIYDTAGLLTTRIDPRGFATTTGWSPTYKPLAVIRPDGSSISNVYDSADRLVAMRNPRGFWFTNHYDAAGRLVATVDALGNVSSNFYDPNGNVIAMRDANGAVVSNQHDALNRIVSVTDPLGNVSSNEYDEAGRLVASLDPQGKRTELEYDAQSRLLATTRPSGATDRFEYDAVGNRTAYRNPDDARISFGFDAMGRLVAETNALGQVRRWGYDEAGNRTSRLDAQGRTTAYAYDAAHRLTNAVYPDDSRVSFSYLPDGRLHVARSAASTNEFAYDAMGRMTQSVFRAQAGVFTVGYTHDPNGNRTATAYPDGQTATVLFDALDLATNAQSAAFGIGGASYVFDAVGNLTGLGLPGGVSGTFTPDAMGRVTAYAYAKTASNFIQRTILRNEMGFKTAENIGVGYYPPGEAERQAREHDAADQLLAMASTNTSGGMDAVFAYDPDGNVTQALHSVSGQVVETIYQWDFDSRLTQVSSGATVVSFSYDALGNLVGMDRNGTNTLFIRDQADPLKRPLVQVDAAGQPLRYFIWANGQLLAQVEAGGATRFAHFDELGNLLAFTDAAGAVTDQFYYEPYGKLRGRTGTTEAPFTWLGAYGVVSAGDDLYLTRHRAYDANLMRFLSRDPIGLDGGFNLYAYGDLNPLAFIDPLGLDSLGASIGPRTAFNDMMSMGPAYTSQMLQRQAFIDRWENQYLVGSAVRSVDAYQHGHYFRSAYHAAGVALQAYATVSAVGNLSAAASRGPALAPKTTSTALSPFRNTRAGETFQHYGYAEHTDSLSGGLRPGGYATMTRGLTGAQARSGLALRHPTAPNSVFTVSPPARTPIRVNPITRPQFGQPGGLPEVEFLLGTPPGSVSGPFPIPGGLP